MNFYKFLIPRLDGGYIERDFERYRGLVKKGVAGFIIFGGKLGIVRQGIKELQKEANNPLIIASDLEQGLGQQIEGGTLFPPAMAITSAIRSSAFGVQRSEVQNSSLVTCHSSLLRQAFKAMAVEARYAGINTIFAPVLDINTNPRNPIIATRAFGEDPETVSSIGCEIVKVFQSNGITACGKHFPGHGDTEVDSHIKLPVIHKGMNLLEETELVPFRDAINKGVKMLMLGHLKVPALDISGIPASLSRKTVRYLRDKLKFKGILITDALNMGGIGDYPEEKASLMALKAGADLILHPMDVDGVVSYLENTGYYPYQAAGRLGEFRKRHCRQGIVRRCDFKKHKRLSEELTRKAIRIKGLTRPMKKPLLIILHDNKGNKYESLISRLKSKYPALKDLIFNTGDDIQLGSINNREIIIAVFSDIRAWKGGPSLWLLKSIKELEGMAKTFISFGSPYLLDEIRNDIIKIYAYWGSASAQEAVAEVI